MIPCSNDQFVAGADLFMTGVIIVSRPIASPL